MFLDTTHADRNSDAFYIGQGACNPVAIAGTLHRHMVAMSRNGSDHPTIKADPAIRLIAHQLAYLLNIGAMDNDAMEHLRVTDAVRDTMERNRPNAQPS